jgi:hypothetical protein
MSEQVYSSLCTPTLAARLGASGRTSICSSLPFILFFLHLVDSCLSSVAMPSWNPFKRRKSAKATAVAEQLEHPSPGLDHDSLQGVHSRQLSPVGERSASHENLLSAQHPQTRMYRMHRRAPFGINVKYKDPPQHPHSPTVSPIPEHHEPPPSPPAHDEHEMIFADEPLHREQPPLPPVEPQKPAKSRGGFFSIFRRKSKKAKAEEAGLVEGSRALSPVSAKGPSTPGRNRLTRKGVCQRQCISHNSGTSLSVLSGNVSNRQSPRILSRGQLHHP